ncbi:type II secretion system F family protein [Klenkia sp. PcliD-1-E]|uniref:type II secretion system F family protein n=1 Tax=Klenkia sp. PcliD-1-E TaxID=2954492 RepID=UPI002097F55B|nr:type II secretion system F family protein [Klenkia sp. PcliD-1-E]MCO7220836.1 type II secretion system F family protein [Klenkia sp. PcliD-1-E]
MSTMQLAILAGGLVGLGVAIIVWRLAPAQPQLAQALARLSPERTNQTVSAATSNGSLTDRLGLRIQRTMPGASLGRTPTAELRMLRIPVHRYYGEKALFFLVGLVFPALAYALLTVLGLTPPIVLPVAAGLAFGAVLSFIPDYNARSEAKLARVEFSYALCSYIDLVALERQNGSGSTQAMEIAATMGDSWVFQRIREELARARWAGTTPWESLTELAQEISLPELAELADVMRLSGEEGATVYNTLRARAASIRNALLADELTQANADGERMTLPVTALALVFLVLLAFPAVLRILNT